eukprot:CAMPEP_0119060952 /NCGR_PEP_ID=MMETSP1178-20130426/4844_1 /TAXON_ID=33656 /ORGANISM="unid sp, Strain CCMP2000" /LENGTH=123 /DNA_ID=CAMNT_0007042111 /DNA_START=213 /DNA_END=584 /DNA_ORIENTATION=+
MTRSPAFFSATNERSNADIRSSADPWASSTSKQTPAKPASLIASISGPPSTMPLSASGENAASLLPPPNERYCAPWYIPDLREKGWAHASDSSSGVMRQDLQASVNSEMIVILASSGDLPAFA